MKQHKFLNIKSEFDKFLYKFGHFAQLLRATARIQLLEMFSTFVSTVQNTFCHLIWKIILCVFLINRNLFMIFRWTELHTRVNKILLQAKMFTSFHYEDEEYGNSTKNIQVIQCLTTKLQNF